MSLTCTLTRRMHRQQGQRWQGPGLRVYDRRVKPLSFSIRYGHKRSLRFGPYVLTYMPPIGNWPRSPLG